VSRPNHCFRFLRRDGRLWVRRTYRHDRRAGETRRDARRHADMRILGYLAAQLERDGYQPADLTAGVR
jgi:hypothetical protein